MCKDFIYNVLSNCFSNVQRVKECAHMKIYLTLLLIGALRCLGADFVLRFLPVTEVFNISKFAANC